MPDGDCDCPTSEELEGVALEKRAVAATEEEEGEAAGEAAAVVPGEAVSTASGAEDSGCAEMLAETGGVTSWVDSAGGNHVTEAVGDAGPPVGPEGDSTAEVLADGIG